MKIVASLVLSALFAVSPRTPLQTSIEVTARELLGNFAAGRFDAATKDFNDDLRPIVTKEVLATAKAQLDQQAGTFVTIKDIRQGRQEGFRSIEMVAGFTKARLSVVVVFDALDRVGAVYFKPILSAPVDPALETLARELLANFSAGRFDDAGKAFDPNMRAQLSPANLANLAKNIAATFGTFQSVTEVQQRTETTYRIIDMTLSCTKGPVAFRVAFDARGQIAALNISPFYR